MSRGLENRGVSDGRQRWRGTFHHGNNERHSETFYGPRREAERWIKQRRDELRGQGVIAPRGTRRTRTAHTMADLFTAWIDHVFPLLQPKTVKQYESQLVRFRKFFVDERSNPKVADVTPADVAAFRTQRIGDGGKVTGRTWNKDAVVLRSIFAWAEEMEWRIGNPVKKSFWLRIAKQGRGVALTREQAEKLLTKCLPDPLLHAAVATAVYSGMRAAELFHLRFQDIDLSARLIRIVAKDRSDGFRTKNGESRVTPIDPILRPILVAHLERARMDGTGSEYVFHHTTARRRAEAGDRLTSLLRGFRGALKTAELAESIRWHDLRHTRITWWALEHRPLWANQRAVGHAGSGSMTDLYSHFTDADVVDALIGRAVTETATNRAQRGRIRRA